jgi:hypothetical protein
MRTSLRRHFSSNPELVRLDQHTLNPKSRSIFEAQMECHSLRQAKLIATQSKNKSVLVDSSFMCALKDVNSEVSAFFTQIDKDRTQEQDFEARMCLIQAQFEICAGEFNPNEILEHIRYMVEHDLPMTEYHTMDVSEHGSPITELPHTDKVVIPLLDIEQAFAELGERFGTNIDHLASIFISC